MNLSIMILAMVLAPFAVLAHGGTPLDATVVDLCIFCFTH